MSPSRRHKLSGVPELFLIRECIRQHDPVDAAGRSAADDIDHNVRVGQRLEPFIYAVAADGPEELARHAVDVDRQRHAAVHHKSKPGLVRFRG